MLPSQNQPSSENQLSPGDQPNSGDQESETRATETTLATETLATETQNVSEVPADNLPPLPDVDLPLLNDPMGYGFQCWAGITVSGAVYVLVCAVLMVVWSLASLVFQGFMPYGSAIELLAAALGAVFGGSIAAVFVAGVVGALCVVLVWLVNLSLGKSVPRRICAISAAGLTGFTALSAGLLANAEGMKFTDVALMFLVGPALATVVMTFFVGYYMDRSCIFYDGVGESGMGLQIKIRHLLAITGWGAFVFAFANLVGMIEISMLALGWVVLQAFTVFVEHFIQKWRTWRFERLTNGRPLEPLDAGSKIVTTEHGATDPIF